jgi:phosphatidylglycerophosphate synthase
MPNNGPGVAHSLSSVPRSKLMPAAVTLFAIGLLAVIAVFGLYAAGQRNLTVWLYVAAMLLPIGLALAVFSVVRRR